MSKSKRSKSKPEGISRREFIDLVGVSIGAAALVGAGCGGGNSGGGSESGAGGSSPGTGGASNGTGGGAATGGTPGAATGGTPGVATGGTPGVTTGGTPGAATGGTPGAATGGTPGVATGGTPGATTGGTPGAATGGTPGAATGGTPGVATGGTPGVATGGTPGVATGGTPGAATGGSTTGAGGKATGGGAATGGVVGTGGSSGTTATALVALVRGPDWVQATQDAIALAGGLPDLSGKTVVLRPNVIENTADATTSPDVIHGVIKAVKAASKGTAPTIIVAEDGWNASSGGGELACMQSLGITAVCTAEGATTMDLGAQGHGTRNGIDFSDPVYNADYVIAIPKCKTHTVLGGFTMALKLWYGNTKNNRSHSDATMPAKLHAIRKADFTVLDATKCMTTGGPSAGGTMVASKIVVASKDAIAVDVTGLLIEKYSGSTVISSWADAWNKSQITGALAQKVPGWLTAKPSAQSQQQFPYAQQGVTEAATIMGY